MAQVLVDTSLNLTDLVDKDAAISALGGTTMGKAMFKVADTAAAWALMGATAIGQSVALAADAAAVLTALGATTVGKALFSAADAGAAQDALGATSLGKSLFTIATAALARTAIGATTIGAAVFTALDAAAARLSLDVYQRGVYGSGGLVTAPKVWRGLSAATNASGVWTCDISAAGFSSIACVTATVLRNDPSRIEICATQIMSTTNTTITGVAGRGLGLLALGDTWRLAPAGVTVYVRVEGA